MIVKPTSLEDVLLVEPVRHGDARGYFQETYQEDRYRAAGINCRFVQDNLSFSERGVLRGLHLQHPKGQDKLVSVMQGEVFDVAVDVRYGSPTFGEWVGERLSAENGRQLFVPKGFAHGYCVTSDTALFAYKCSEIYAPDCEVSIRWDDPDIGIDWPVTEPILSARDAALPLLRGAENNFWFA